MRVSCTIALAVAAALFGPACESTLPPEGQVLLYLDTDAPLASPGDVASPERWREPAPLFDRVLIELYAPGEPAPCADCRRELVVDADKMKARRFSFGFVGRPRVVGYRARLVLYRSAGGLAPRRESSIELVGYLPAVAEEGITELTARFRAEDAGKPRGTLEAPVLFDRGAPVVSAVATWPGGAVVDCAGEPPPGSVCVPGGAFFMGDPRVTLDESIGGAREHLAVMPPFFLDATEVTIAAMRASKLAVIDSRGRSKDPVDDFADELGSCDYSSSPGSNEDLPVTCVSWTLASSFCRAKGGDLPTEAELEMVGSRRGTSLTPWGDREPSCTDAAVARQIRRDAGGCSDAPAFGLETRVLPARPGESLRDRVALPGGEVVDVGANVSEWTRDGFQRDDGACWSQALLTPPECVVPDAERMSIKGGAFLTLPVPFIQARRSSDRTFQPPEVGFRCAYPAANR